MSNDSTTLEMPRLTTAQRDDLLSDFNRDGYVILPQQLPDWLNEACLAGVDAIAAADRAADPDMRSVKKQNAVDHHDAFRQLMLYTPALQMAYDVFGPMFQLNQSNIVSRQRDLDSTKDYVNASPWHADGPRPGQFPTVNGVMGLHYLKFGYFFTDLTHGTGGSLQVVRGSHLRPELDGKGGDFKIDAYQDDLVQFDCPAGTVVAFHQAQWHAAPGNQSDIERKNAYISYCPTWMRPFDREPLSAAEAATLDPVSAFLLGAPRPSTRWWLPSAEDKAVLQDYAR